MHFDSGLDTSKTIVVYENVSKVSRIQWKVEQEKVFKKAVSRGR